MILWICMLRQSPQRPPAEHVHRQATFLLDELKASKAAHDLPVQSVDDGMFAIAALLDEVAMGLPDLYPLWSSHPLQAVRWMTNNAGEEVFQRLQRVRQGPRNILATYMVVFGVGFQGRFGLPGAIQYGLVQVRREVSLQLGVDPDRDWKGGVLRAPTQELEPSDLLPKEPFYKSVIMGRIVTGILLLAGALTLGLVLYSNLS
ncbi:MAG: DotU family type IV/VI secretion system protein [Polyangiaceae bacterium]|nr:DotU family type IV/VI secretion system protein [Polyangiaceae bacterium]